MRMSHVAIWTNDLERSRDFYVRYFGGESNSKYVNESKGFSSYMVTFSNGMILEIMKKVDILQYSNKLGNCIGFSHMAFSAGSDEKVREMVEVFRRDGVSVAGEPRRTGDGFYEAVILDPDGNLIEIVG